MKTESYLELACTAAKAAGMALLARSQAGEAEVLSQEGRDIKTGADLEAEACILEMLKPSGLPILAEESGLSSVDPSQTIPELLAGEDPLWIVDPLDGTYNYVRGIPVCGVSIALWQHGRPQLGVIYDFHADELWTGSVDQPACCNGVPVHVSEIAEASEGVLMTGFPAKASWEEDSAQAFWQEMRGFKKVRMIGSAAMALVYVARGWAEVYHERGTWVWDIAAGVALIEAAGGEVEWEDISPAGQLRLRAHNGHLFAS